MADIFDIVEARSEPGDIFDEVADVSPGTEPRRGLLGPTSIQQAPGVLKAAGQQLLSDLFSGAKSIGEIFLPPFARSEEFRPAEGLKVISAPFSAIGAAARTAAQQTGVTGQAAEDIGTAAEFASSAVPIGGIMRGVKKLSDLFAARLAQKQAAAEIAALTEEAKRLSTLALPAPEAQSARFINDPRRLFEAGEMPVVRQLADVPIERGNFVFREGRFEPKEFEGGILPAGSPPDKLVVQGSQPVTPSRGLVGVTSTEKGVRPVDFPSQIGRRQAILSPDEAEQFVKTGLAPGTKVAPIRLREGKIAEAPTVGEVKMAGEELLSPVSQRRLAAGQFVEESSKTIAKTMGEEGQLLTQAVKAARNDAEIDVGQVLQPLKERLKTLTDEQKSNLVDVLEGKAQPVDVHVLNESQFIRAELDKVAARAQASGLQIRNPITGAKYPFQPRGDFFPHLSKEELSQVVRTPDGRARVKAAIAQELRASGGDVSDKAVEQALQAMVKASRGRYGNLEIARVVDLGDYIRDPEVALTKYFNDAYRRINFAEKLGPEFEEAERLLTRIGQRYGDDAERFGRTYYQRAAGIEPSNDTLVRSFLGTARNFEATTKLGQSVIPNLSQSAYTAIVTGSKATAKGLKDAMTKGGQDFALRAGVTLDSTIQEFLREATGAAGEGFWAKAAGFVLRRTGFSSVERGNRILAANAGRYFALDTFEKLAANPVGKGAARLRETLEKMNVDVEGALGRGSLSEIDELRAAQNIVNRTQFKTDVSELPLFWTSPEGRTLTQFKSFNFKSGQFVKDEILKEMAKGNVAPFLRAAAILPGTGFAVRSAQRAIRPGTQGENEGLADYLAAVGTFGVFADLFVDAGRAFISGPSFAAGPTISDVGQGLAGIKETKRRILEGKAAPLEPVGRFAVRQVPILGPSLPGLVFPKKQKRSELAPSLGGNQ